ncbi:MAG: site-2 protease family protein [Alphaproteobacteria bacterium]|nr:site-2 protease family protein [Alphaproteobacteria bacterium]
MDPVSILYAVSVIAIPAILAITLHEAAHGYVAWKLGDDTALRLGRVSFNPLRHIDPFGTLLLPIMLRLLGSPFLFGYAKPVPVNFGRLRQPRRDMVWVAAAGPGINLGLALASGVALHLGLMFEGEVRTWLVDLLTFSIFINLLLAVFNMLPLPPLDGGRVAVGLLPDVLAYPLARLERFGIVILLAVMILPPILGSSFGLDLNPFGWLILPPVQFLFELVLTLTGHQ